MTRLCNCPESLASTLELVSRKNQLTEESCKTCGGRFLVDGIGPASASMLSTVGPEVTNSINPELSWKTVTKGRRSRKPVARNMSKFAKLGNRSPKRVGDFSVSDSVKFDRCAAGRHFPDKVEHIPIKKRRRPLLQSPSPPPHSSSVNNEESLSAQPQTPSPHADHWRSDSYTKQQLKGFGRSAAVKFTDDVDRVDADTISDVTNRKLYDPDDFSGIALLAAAACIDSMNDVTDTVEKELRTELLLPEKFDTATPPDPIRRRNTCVELENPLQKEVVKEDNVKCSFYDYSFSLSQSLRENDEGGTVRKEVSSKVGRLHWDLNVVMDAWEQPFDDSVEGAYLKDVSDHNIKGEKLDQTEENKSEPVCAPDRDYSKEVSITKLDEPPGKSINNLHVDAEISNQVVSKISSYPSSPLPKLYQVSCVSNDEKMMRTALGGIGVVQEDAKKFKEMLSSDNVQIGVENIAFPELFSENSARESSINSRVAEVSGEVYALPENSTSLHEDSTSLRRIASTVICKTQETENSGSNSYEADHYQSSSKCEDLSASCARTHSPVGATVTEYKECVVSKEPASKYDQYVCNEGAKSSSILPYSSKKDDGALSDDPTSCSAKIGSSLDDCHNSDISQDDRCNTVVSKDMTELQVGYDSPYEDGEVRVSMSYPWEENEIEDGENECVDYESEAREGVDSDGADYPGSEVVEAGSEGSQGMENRSLVVREGSVSDCNRSGSLKSSLRMHYMKCDNEKIDNGGMKGSTCGSDTTIGQFESNDDSLRRGHTSEHMDVYDVRGSRVEESGSRAARGKLLSRIAGPSSMDPSERKDTGFLPHSRSRIHSRPGRDVSPNKIMGRQRSTFHVRGGNGGDEQWGYWDSRNRFPSSYHGPDGHGYTRTRSIIADSADKFGGLNSQDHRQSINYSSKGIHRTLGRRSPFDRDDYYSVHRRMPAARDITANRSRGGLGNYMQGGGRGLRDDQHKALPDHRAASSGHIPRYLSRRERSFSPSSGRVPQNSLPHRKSRSRSRTRSPHAWRERNQGVRRHSRSPDFRSDARVERERMPLQKPSFPADYSRSITSPPRGRSSPQRNCRWVDNHDYIDDYSRNRRSPVRVFRWCQRFDSAGSGRLKSDDYFRRPGRFPPIAGTGRGCKFDDNYDDRRRDDRVETLHRARHSDAGGAVNRFRHDAENNSENDVRNTDRRDVPRSSREDKRSFKV